MATRPIRGNPVWRSSLWVFVLFNILDLASTRIALSHGMNEANPLPATLLMIGGQEAVVAFKAAAVLAVVAIMWFLGQPYPGLWKGLKVANVLLGTIVLSNSIQVFLGA